MKCKERSPLPAGAEWAVLPCQKSHFVSYYTVRSTASGHKRMMDGCEQRASWCHGVKLSLLKITHEKEQQLGNQLTVRWIVEKLVLGETDVVLPSVL